MGMEMEMARWLDGDGAGVKTKRCCHVPVRNYMA